MKKDAIKRGKGKQIYVHYNKPLSENIKQKLQQHNIELLHKPAVTQEISVHKPHVNKPVQQQKQKAEGFS